jgi:hypothetical protein
MMICREDADIAGGRPAVISQEVARAAMRSRERLILASGSRIQGGQLPVPCDDQLKASQKKRPLRRPNQRREFRAREH